MKRFNIALTVLAIVVLCVTLSILFWLRGRSVQALEEAVENARLSFDAETVLGEPSDPRADFAAAETLAANAMLNPFIRDLVVTKRRSGLSAEESEVPVVPYDLRARDPDGWRARLADWRKLPLQSGERAFGYLYFNLDRSAIRSVNGAIGAASLALILTLAILVARVYSQETSLVRAGHELQQRKRELIRLERLALAGQLSAGLLHDLKKPVLQIRHDLEDLEDALGEASGAAALGDMKTQARLFFQMLHDSQMERFVRSDRVQEEYIDVHEVLEMSLRLVHYERRSVTVAERFADGLPPVLAQPYRLVQVFSNLILNAYQAMGGEGTLTIETGERGGGIGGRRGEIGGGIGKSGARPGEIEVTLTDDGPGIAPDALPRVFEPFFTTKGEADGSGLGLAICRMIVEDLGGRIEVESLPGRSTTFGVWLPVEGGERGEG